MGKDEAVVEALAELGPDASPAAVKQWVKEKRKMDVDNTLVARVKQDVKAKLVTLASPPPPKPAPVVILDVAVVTEALDVARRLVTACGGKDAAKRLIDAC